VKRKGGLPLLLQTEQDESGDDHFSYVTDTGANSIVLLPPLRICSMELLFCHWFNRLSSVLRTSVSEKCVGTRYTRLYLTHSRDEYKCGWKSLHCSEM
jgi:hypothetical protein